MPYNANGADAATSTVPVALSHPSGTQLYVYFIDSTLLARTGYNFAGWNTAADGSGTSFTSSGLADYYLTQNITLYAQWTLANPTYTVTYDNGQEGDNHDTDTDATNYENNSQVVIKSFTDAGFTAPENKVFDYWTINGEGQYAPGGNYTINAANVTFTAHYSPKYTVTYDNGQAGDNHHTYPDNSSYVNNSQVVIKTFADAGFTAPENKVFDYWTIGEVKYAPGDSYTINGADVTFTAHYSDPATAEYRVIYNKRSVVDACKGYVPVDNTVYHDGDTVTVKDISTLNIETGDDGDFYCWRADDADGVHLYQPGDTFVIHSNVLLYPSMQLVVYRFVYDANGGQNAPDTQRFIGTDLNADGARVKGPGNMTRANYVFAGWLSDKDNQIYNGGDYSPVETDWEKRYLVTFKAQWNPVNQGPVDPEPEHNPIIPEPIITVAVTTATTPEEPEITTAPETTAEETTIVPETTMPETTVPDTTTAPETTETPSDKSKDNNPNTGVPIAGIGALFTAGLAVITAEIVIKKKKK